MPRSVVLPPEAAEALAAFVPDLASPEHVPFIREQAVHYAPKDRRDAVKAASALSGLVYWAERTGRPVDADELLTEPVIRSYVASALSGFAVSTQNTHASVLNRVRRGREGLRPESRGPSRGERGRRGIPYEPDEIDALLLWAQNQPSDKRRHALLALLVLGLGAGLDAADVVVVQASDVRRDPATGAVVVTVRHPLDGPKSRTVPFLARYEQDALSLAIDAGSGWIVNPGVGPDAGVRNNAVHSAVKQAAPAADAPPLLLARTRATWVRHHLAASTRLDVLVEAAGFKNASAIRLYVPFLDPVPARDAVIMLSQAGQQQTRPDQPQN